MDQSFARRFTECLLNATGLPELIESNPDDYEVFTIEFNMDIQKLYDIKLKLVNIRLTAPLFH
jgi:predicted O-linked N-acetylglucosamine transferase (SPINDLY family)